MLTTTHFKTWQKVGAKFLKRLSNHNMHIQHKLYCLENISVSLIMVDMMSRNLCYMFFSKLLKLFEDDVYTNQTFVLKYC